MNDRDSRPDRPIGSSHRSELAVDQAFEMYRVVRMYCDPPYWQTDIDGWRAKYGDKVVQLVKLVRGAK